MLCYKALVKSIKLCSGYYGCGRCTQRRSVGWPSMIYLEITNLTLRTDKTFQDQTQEEHHLPSDVSLFCQLLINMIEQFPAEYVHQFCLGIRHVKQVSLQHL